MEEGAEQHCRNEIWRIGVVLFFILKSALRAFVSFSLTSFFVRPCQTCRFGVAGGALPDHVLGS